MVSEKKRETLREVKASIEKYPVIGLVDMHDLPARQLFHIKQQLKGKALIRMVKKRVIMLAGEESKKSGMKELTGKIQGQPALLFSEANPFELAHKIAKSVSKALAKEGDIAPIDIVIPAGPTNLPPGPAIGELQKMKIPAGVEGDKIFVKKDTRIVKEGKEISKDAAGVMAKLGIEPMEISLNLVAVLDSGTVFDKELLFIPPEHYIGQIKSAYSNALNVALNIDYLTADTLTLLLSKAHQQALSLALEADILTSETVGSMLAKAHGQAAVLKGMAKEEPAEEKSKPETGEEEEKEEAGSPEEKEKEPEPAPSEEGEKGEEKPGEKGDGEEKAEEPAEGKVKESGPEEKEAGSEESGKDKGEKETVKG